jgi:hypothetical protein
MAAMIMSLSFISCGDDGDDGETNDNPPVTNNSSGGSQGGGFVVSDSLLVGTWEFVDGVEKVKYSYNGQQMPEQTIQFDRAQIREIASQNGYGIWDEVLNITKNTVNGQPYTLNGNVLMDYADKEKGVSFVVEVKSLNKANMVLHEVIKIDTEGMAVDIDADMNYKNVSSY